MGIKWNRQKAYYRRCRRASLMTPARAMAARQIPDPMDSIDKPEQRNAESAVPATFASDRGAILNDSEEQSSGRHGGIAGGYVKSYRKFVEHPIFTQCAPSVFKVAHYFLYRANFRPIQWYDGRQIVRIPAGAFITSYARTAEACNISVQQARDAFEHLFRTHFATNQRTRRWTLVIISNWTAYQAPPDGAEHTEERTVDHLRNT